MTAKDLIVKRLEEAGTALAAHEMHIVGYSENNICTRLSELAREGIVKGHYRVGDHCKEWRLVKKPVFDSMGQGVLL